MEEQQQTQKRSYSEKHNRLSIYLKKDEIQEIKRIARQKRMKENEVAKRILRHWLTTNKVNKYGEIEKIPIILQHRKNF